jgi:hypothetical protein
MRFHMHVDSFCPFRCSYLLFICTVADFNPGPVFCLLDACYATCNMYRSISPPYLLKVVLFMNTGAREHRVRCNF